MRRLQRIAGLATVLMVAVAAVLPSGTGAAPPKEGPVVVGRVSHVEGELLSYIYEEKDWVPILQDVPFGLEDTLYSDPDAKAEIIFPNSTWVRIGGNTQIQAIALDEDVTEIDVASGIARFYNRGGQGVVKATTPFGYVLAPAGAMFDLYVGDESVEVIALRESVDFVHATGQSRYEVQSGSSSLVADNRVVAAGQGMVDADFDDWNGRRDSLWAKRLEVKGDSIRYLPPQMHDDAYEFEENGRWERVQYQGEYRNLWRPTRVGPEWRPYTYGRWTSYYGDQNWVPSEPFGYTTHHYGSWVFIDTCRCWYWAPPVASVNVIVGRPWTVGYGWYPGRVSWVYSDANVGWVPLAPYEPYYANRYWGPSSVAVATMNLAASVINLVALSNLDHAVFVGRRDFWGVNNYHTHVVKNINKTTIINNYYGSPVVDRRVIRDFDDRRDRFHYVNRDVKFKPHRSVVERIDRNQRLAARQERIEAQALLRDTRNVRRGDVDRGVRMERPKVTNRLVSADSVDKPASELRFQQRELKRQEREQRAVDQRVLRQQQREGRQQQQMERREGSERTRPERPSRDTLDQRRIERDERLQQQQERRQMREEREQTRPERPDADQRQQQREERQRQLEERRQMRQQTRPDQPDADQRQQQREERQRQLEERRQLREQTRPERPDTDQRQQQREERQRQLEERRQLREQTRPERPDTDQRQQQREERQRQLEERRQPRQDREQTRPERPDAEQQRQMREERQRQQREQQQQQMERQQQEQRRQMRDDRQQQQQQRQQREQEQQLRQQQQMERQQQEQRRQMRDDRQQQQQQRQQREQEQQLRQQQQMERQQQQQERRQMRDDRQQQLQQQQQRQQREKEQQQQNRRRPKGQEEQPQEGAQTQ